MKQLQNTIYLLLISVFVLFTCLINNNSQTARKVKESKTAIGFCGTTSPNIDYFGKFDPIKGKSLFKSNCANCHALNMRSDITGPALGGSFKLWNYDTIAYYKYLQNSALYFESNDNKRLEKLQIHFNFDNSHSFTDLTKEEVNNILAFINI